MENSFNKFSVSLGLLDYVNPILYTITMVTIIKNLYKEMEKPYSTLLLIGAAISVIFGFVIPTGKVIVGLGLIKFVMPVSLVLCVNSGILISGWVLFRHVVKPKQSVLWIMTALILIFLTLIYMKGKKLNTVAVLIGAVGYMLIYISLIILSIRQGSVFPVILYGLAILLFVMLCGIGIKANLYDPKIHWVIEISNVTCQLFVAIATVKLFSK